MEAMVNADGWRVEAIQLQVSLSRPPRSYLRVKDGPFFVADYATVAEVAQYVDLASLVREPHGG